MPDTSTRPFTPARTGTRGAHLAVEPDTGLFTGFELTKGTGKDNHEAAVGQRLLEREPDGIEVLGDSAYGTAEMRTTLADPDSFRSAVIKPPPLRPAGSGRVHHRRFNRR